MHSMELPFGTSAKQWQRSAKYAQASLAASRPVKPKISSTGKHLTAAVKSLPAKTGTVCSATGPSKNQGGTRLDHSPQVLCRRQHSADDN